LNAFESESRKLHDIREADRFSWELAAENTENPPGFGFMGRLRPQLGVGRKGAPCREGLCGHLHRWVQQTREHAGEDWTMPSDARKLSEAVEQISSRPPDADTPPSWRNSSRGRRRRGRRAARQPKHGMCRRVRHLRSSAAIEHRQPAYARPPDEGHHQHASCRAVCWEYVSGK